MTITVWGSELIAGGSTAILTNASFARRKKTVFTTTAPTTIARRFKFYNATNYTSTTHGITMWIMNSSTGAVVAQQTITIGPVSPPGWYYSPSLDLPISGSYQIAFSSSHANGWSLYRTTLTAGYQQCSVNGVPDPFPSTGLSDLAFDYAFGLEVDELSYSVTSINGVSSPSVPNVNLDSSNSAVTFALTDISSVNLSNNGWDTVASSVSMPSGSGTFGFTWPYPDNSTQSLFGANVATFTDTLGHSATTAANKVLPSTHSETIFENAINYGPTFLGSLLTLPNSDRIYYPNSGGLVIAPNGEVSINISALPTSVPIILHNMVTGVVTTKTLIITVEGVVVVIGGGGLTANGLTISGLTASGITAVGL